MSEMMKYIEENVGLNKVNQRMEKHIEEKVKMVEKPQDVEKVQQFEKIITSDNKNSLEGVPSS